MSPEPAEQAEPADADSPALALAKRRGKRVSLALFLALASAFIVLSTWEVIAGVFGFDAPGGMAAHGKPDEACARALRAFGQATAASGPRGRVGTAVVAGLIEPLSDRELEVLHLLAAGKPNQQIAEELVVALNTVKKHVTHILDKLGAANRTEATARARELGLLR